jgi:hypothetical protein
LIGDCGFLPSLRRRTTFALMPRSLREAECPVPSKACRRPPPLCDRWIAVGNAASRREEETRKEFRRRVADNALKSPDSPPKMEGIGSDFRRFESSRTRRRRVFEITGRAAGGELGFQSSRSPRMPETAVGRPGNGAAKP